MKKKTIQAYFCDHCNKLYQRKHFAIQHEERCSRNPTNKRPCFDCEYLQFKETTISEDTWRGTEEEIPVQAFYCSKLKHYLLPPIAEHKGNYFEFGDEENISMPKECPDFKDTFEDLYNFPFFETES